MSIEGWYHIERPDAKKQARAAEREKEFQASLAQRRAQLKREWMIDHPNESPFTFDRKVWPLMLKNTKEREFSRNARIEAERERILATRSHMYSIW